MWGSLAAAAVGAFLAEMLRRRREPAGEREISDYQMKIRARKQAELEAQWAREAAKKQSQARTAAMDAKIEREDRKKRRLGKRGKAVLKPWLPSAPSSSVSKPPQPIRRIARASGPSRSRRNPGGSGQETGCNRRSSSRCSSI